MNRLVTQRIMSAISKALFNANNQIKLFKGVGSKLVKDGLRSIKKYIKYMQVFLHTLKLLQTYPDIRMSKIVSHLSIEFSFSFREVYFNHTLLSGCIQKYINQVGSIHDGERREPQFYSKVAQSMVARASVEQGVPFSLISWGRN